MSDIIFGCPDLTKFCRLDELGLVVVGQHLQPDRAVLACRVVEPDRWCRRCGCEITARDTVTRGWRTSRWDGARPCCWSRSAGTAAVAAGTSGARTRTRLPSPRAKLSRAGPRWALEGIVRQHLSVARVAEGLGVSWNTANTAVLGEGRSVLIGDPHRFDAVTAIGVDEHVRRHARRGDKYVTLIIDLTPVRAGTDPARLLDMVEGRTRQAFQQWLAARDPAWRAGVEVVAMDGFTGFTTATTTDLPDTVAVMDPFHVMRLAGDALDQCRRRIQQATCGHRGRTSDPLYAARRGPCTPEPIC